VIVRSAVRFAVAVGLVAVSVLCRLALSPVLHAEAPFVAYYPSVAVASLIGGLWPGLVATGLATLAALFVPALDPMQTVWARPSAAASAVFVVASALIAWAADRARRLVIEREEAAERALASERQAQHLLGSIGDAFISVDSEWRIRYANDAAMRFVNVTGADLIGRAWDTSWPLLGEQARASCRKAMDERTDLQFEDFDDALDRALDVRVFPSADGGLSIRMADVSEARRASRSLVDSERQLRLALRASRVGVWHADLSAGTVWCSTEALDILGIPEDAVSSERLLALVHPDDVQVVMDSRRQVLHGGTECTLEFRAKRPDGRLLRLEVRGQRIGDEGERLAGVILDATERWAAEQRRVSEAMQTGPGAANANALAPQHARTAVTSPASVDAAQRAFTSHLAHELRTPLNALVGWCDVLRRGGGDPAQVAAATDVIARNARAMAQMLTELTEAPGGLQGRAWPMAEARAAATVALERDVAHGAGSAVDQRLDGLTLLLLEDDADSRTVTARLLGDAGADVHLAERASAALEMLSRIQVDVIVSDIGLPEMDGYEFIRRVRSLPPERGGSTAAIALTAHAHADDRRRALLAGYQMHIAKPLNPIEFQTAVHSMGRLARATGLGRT
jgi:PAS domain S-box-containing protein